MSKAFCSVSGARQALIDAQVVAQLPIAGAIILGKAHTTEFAYFDGPPPTAIKKQPQPLFVETPEHVQSVPMHGTRATGLKIGSFRTARTIVIRAWGVDADSGVVIL